jgi:hypothetical protein
VSGAKALIDHAMAAWDDAYTQAAKTFWGRLSSARQRGLAHQLLRHEVLRGDVHLTWLLKKENATYCYGLNRFLTKLVLLAYELITRRNAQSDIPVADRPSEQPIVLTSHRLSDLPSAVTAHACDPTHVDDEACPNHAHKASVVHSSGLLASVELGTYHVLVLRHGLQPAELFGGAAQREQIMPIDWI